MNKTKQKILATALAIFNEQGVASISIRQLAQEAKISHSNLIYHFPSKQEIVLALHEQLFNRANDINKKIEIANFSLAQLYNITKIGFATVYDFRFLFNDLQFICSSFPEMRKILLSAEKNRSDMYRSVIALMIEKKWMKAAEFENEYKQLIVLIKIFSDHWLVSSSIYDNLPVLEKIEKYSRLLMAHFYPYLTPMGKEEFKSIQIK